MAELVNGTVKWFNSEKGFTRSIAPAVECPIGVTTSQ
jgi:hypothetical protein